jgi:hypothetical protein
MSSLHSLNKAGFVHLPSLKPKEQGSVTVSGGEEIARLT